MSEFWLKSDRVVLPSGVKPAVLRVANGAIESIDEFDDLEHLNLDDRAGAPIVDARGLVVGPGLVDCHVHINEPGRTEWEGFDTATRAAAAGGVTTVVDMPLNCIPVTTTRAALEEKLAACREQCFVDLGFWGGVVPGNANDLRDLAYGGVLGCKAFLVHSGIDEFPNATEADLREAMPILAELGLPLLAHAELDLGAPAHADDPRSYRSYLASRPPAWEDEAIALLIELSRQTGCAVHIVHLSSASSVPALRAAKAEGLPIMVETCPHYLCIEAECIPDGATEYKCAPPIRDHDNREALWSALFEGVIDFVITDHSPCTPGLKQQERGHFDEAWGGIASLSLGLAAIWTEARPRGATLEQMARWMSTAPARFAGLPQKGALAVGRDADIVVWDPDETFNVTPERLHFRHKLSPYLKRHLTGRVKQTFVRGHRVFADDAPLEPPVGNLLLGRS